MPHICGSLIIFNLCILSEYLYQLKVKLKFKLKSWSCHINDKLDILFESMGVEKPTCQVLHSFYLLLTYILNLNAWLESNKHYFLVSFLSLSNNKVYVRER